MPQMAPMWWLMLYMIFNILLIITMKMIFFSAMKTPQKKTVNMKKNNMNWKW